jgi:hypothetical protein
MPIDQIQQREQINPNNVNEVPVQAYIFDGRVVIGVEAAFAGLQNQPEQKTGTYNHVESMQTGHAEIQREIKLRVGIEVGINL